MCGLLYGGCASAISPGLLWGYLVKCELAGPVLGQTWVVGSPQALWSPLGPLRAIQRPAAFLSVPTAFLSASFETFLVDEDEQGAASDLLGTVPNALCVAARTGVGPANPREASPDPGRPPSPWEAVSDPGLGEGRLLTAWSCATAEGPEWTS